MQFGLWVGILGGKGLPVPQAWAALAILFEIGAPLLILIGAGTRFAAVALLLFTFAATLLSHRYWAMAGAARQANEINFWKNIAIMGGLLFLHVSGAGRFSWDGWRTRRPASGRAAPPVAG